MKKTLSALLVGILLIVGLFTLTGCGNEENKKAEENTENKTAKAEVEEKKQVVNPELEGTEVFVQDGNDIVAIKDNGTKITLIKDYTDKKMINLDYDDGKLYLSNYSVEVINGQMVGPVRQQTPLVTDRKYDMIDLNKGNGNYAVENLYSYNPEDNTTMSVDSPKACNGKIYFIKNAKEIIELDVATKKEKTIDTVSARLDNMILAIELLLDEQNSVLYYTTATDGKSKIMQYDISTSEKKSIKEGSGQEYFNLLQITNEGLYYTETTNSTEGFSRKFYEYVFDKKESNMITDNSNFAPIVGEPYIYAMQEIPLDGVDDYVGETNSNYVVFDKKMNKVKELFSNVEYNNNNGVMKYNDKYTQMSVNGKYYLVNNETLETKETDNFYLRITSFK